MAPKLTKQQKADLVLRLCALKEAQARHLRTAVHKAAVGAERKVHRRVKKVSMTVRSVPILEVLNYERRASPTIAEIGKLARRP
ncbi:hypothetical protein METBIDRAFT_42762 [Metschnikowia bicuspidata var. bicuspidata NRRL YB-4993]|uniref:Uncharacterized protein n=1 Tax=Metschnikowia bicuspidata var. bicuspidata NRRL YB-4993 TaxID=869754 RepID=A0A1A0HC18_9ASCO|nr:hypothetical protein METBIDRAFT_42762 [Metschnikowia bicuspidata var. bicuspidata NRRL YB-4993]OBA21556.1 hypothetical protein METBIDRAFT_42762 [Metschnikowia bicuspidata var. bicuspidata NRRL YB-4993]